MMAAPIRFLPKGVSTDVSYTQAGFHLGWELDFWGRLRRLSEAARAEYLATKEARHGVSTILVADEPTGDLDAKNAADTLELLQRLNEEFQKTIIMVTHDPKAAGSARRTLHLEKGLLAEGQEGQSAAVAQA